MQSGSVPITRRKRLFFSLILILIPVFLMFCLEGLLRLLQYGGEQKLFMDAPAPYRNFLIQNPHAVRRTFPGLRQPPTLSYDFLLKKKPENGFRLFVLGGSTTAGFPYGNNLAFGRILSGRLEQALPDRTIEVVTVAASAINTYTLNDWMEEILGQDPDGILIYAGHNEYYGAFGAGSMLRAGRNPVLVRIYLGLLRVRLFLLMRDCVQKIRGVLTSGKGMEKATLMERMIGEKEIPLGGSLYQSGERQFEYNLSSMVRKAKKSGVPVILGDLVCNLRDQKPFVSSSGKGSADSLYHRAKELDQRAVCDSARAYYTRAKDSDLLRFRAPSSFNEIIRRTGEKESVPVAGVLARFEENSTCGLIGDHFMSDHLHPNIDGEFLLSRIFFDAVADAGWFASPRQAPDETVFRRHWGYTDLDSLFGVYSIRALKRGWPYEEKESGQDGEGSGEPANRVEELAARAEKYDNYSLVKAHRELAEQYDAEGQTESAFREYRALVCMNRLNEDYPVQAARTLFSMKRWEEMIPLLEKSLRIRESASAHALLGQSLTHTGRDKDAVAHLERAVALDPGRVQLPVYKYLIEAYARLGDEQKARLWTGKLKELDPRMAEQLLSHDVEVYAGIHSKEVISLLTEAQKFIVARRFDKALPLLAKSLEIEETPLAHWWIGKIYLMAEKPDLAVRHMLKARSGLEGDAKLLYDLAVAYAFNGRNQEAAETLAELKKLNPAFQDPMGIRQKIGLQ
ncbi:tetratricopeptide repeat protein [bacterium]|nr:tetratricopeptide repeat protein [bacterium]